jgi:hypothetical protein
MVPITQGAVAGDPTGNVSAGNLDQWLDFTRRIHPLAEVDAIVRQPYVTQTILQNTSTSWTIMLSEVRALKVSSDHSTRYYYGVVRVSYNSGIAGIGYVPFVGSDADNRAALGWDYQPSGGEVAAHEWGHNFGRGHAPCDVAQSGDWPTDSRYAGGSIGRWGWDNVTNELKNPATYTDVMGYCNTQWISDYNYDRILAFRMDVSYAVQEAPVEGILVWGRVVDGQVVLEPAFEVTAPASADRGEWTAEVVDEAGGRIATRRFSTALVADLPGEPRTFAFVLPLDRAGRGRAAALRVAGPGGAAERRASPLPPGARAVAPTPAVERAGDRTRLRWDPSRFGAAMVRDAATGDVLTIVRGGGAAEVTGARGDLDVTFSDGVRSARARVKQ